MTLIFSRLNALFPRRQPRPDFRGQTRGRRLLEVEAVRQGFAQTSGFGWASALVEELDQFVRRRMGGRSINPIWP